MTVVRRALWRRWSLVGAATAILLSTPAAVAALPVHAPAVPLADLVAKMRASARVPYQGYAVSSGTAGLPDLPSLGGVSKLLDGDTELRVWYAAPDSWRVDTVDVGAERDLYQTQDSQVIWDYGANQLTVVTGTAPVRLPRGADLVPPDLARRLLDTAGDADRMTALPARRVAGVAADGVRITPSDPDTTVGRVDIWADPATGLPLQVEVTARGATAPVLVTRFLEYRRSAPPAGVLIPPPARNGIGFTVTDAPEIAGVLSDLQPGRLPPELAGRPRVDVGSIGTYGTGLSRFVLLPVPGRTGQTIYKSLTDAGGAVLDLPFGFVHAVVIGTPLVSVMVVVRGNRAFVLAGLISAKVLQEAGTALAMGRRR